MRVASISVCALALVALLHLLSSARADQGVSPEQEAQVLVEHAAELGRDGKLDESIATFKQAKQIFPRAMHDCNIGLAYVRLSQWPQAHYFLSRCREDWTQEQVTPIDEWVNRRLREAAERLQVGAFAPVAISTVPSGASVRISSFDPEESLPSSRVVWLPAGTTEIVASLPGHEDKTLSIMVSKGQQQALRIELDVVPAPDPVVESGTAIDPGTAIEPGTAVEPEIDTHASLTTSPEPGPKTTHSARSGPWIIAGGGAALLGAGVFFHVSALSAKDTAETYAPGEDFDRWNDRFATRRLATLALYGVGAAVLGAGLYLALQSDDQADAKAWVGVRSDGQDTSLSLHWIWQ